MCERTTPTSFSVTHGDKQKFAQVGKVNQQDEQVFEVSLPRALMRPGYWNLFDLLPLSSLLSPGAKVGEDWVG